MSSQAKALISGVLVGGVMLAVLFLNAARLDRRLDNLKAECRKEAKHSEFAKLGGELICDPRDLASSKDAEPPGVQGELARAQRSRDRWYESGEFLIPTALLLVVVGSLPWIWYFLLHRIRELSSAIRGK